MVDDLTPMSSCRVSLRQVVGVIGTLDCLMVNIGCFSVVNANGTFVPTAVLEETRGKRIGIHNMHIGILFCFNCLDDS